MTESDFAGLPISLTEADAVDDWGGMVTAFLAHSAETPDHLTRVIEKAPAFGLAHAVKGLFLILLGRSELIPSAHACHTAALQSGGTPRERAYTTALGKALAGKLSHAAAVLDSVSDLHPEDTLAMKLVHAIRFIVGDRRGMLAAMARTVPRLCPDHPHLGYAKGCLAFALEENGAYGEAEAAGRAGLELAADDAWGLHAVAHVYDMTARNSDGLAWLDQHTATWAHCNNFGGHVWWHLALFHLDRGNHDRVLDLYDTQIRAASTDDYRDIANAASLLMRLEIEDIAIGDRWDELAALAAGRVEDGALVFADLHYLLALGGGHRDAEADAMIARMMRDAAVADHEQHEIAGLSGVPAAQGLSAFRAGHYRAAYEHLAQCRPDLHRIGGSHAQRDVFSRLMIESAIRAGQLVEAETALCERTRRRGAEDGFTARRRATISRRVATGATAA